MKAVPHIDPKEGALIQFVQNGIAEERRVGAVGGAPVRLNERPVILVGHGRCQDLPDRTGDHVVENRRKARHPGNERGAALPGAGRGNLLVIEDFADRVFRLFGGARRNAADRHIGERVAVEVGIPVVRGDMRFVAEAVDDLGRNTGGGDGVERRAERIVWVGRLAGEGGAVADNQNRGEPVFPVQGAELLPYIIRFRKNLPPGEKRRFGLAGGLNKSVNPIPLRLAVENPPLHRGQKRARCDESNIPVRNRFGAGDGQRRGKKEKNP